MISRKAETEVKERFTGGKTDRHTDREGGSVCVCVCVRAGGRKNESECVCEKEREIERELPYTAKVIVQIIDSSGSLGYLTRIILCISIHVHPHMHNKHQITPLA